MVRSRCVIFACATFLLVPGAAFARLPSNYLLPYKNCLANSYRTSLEKVSKTEKVSFFVNAVVHDCDYVLRDLSNGLPDSSKAQRQEYFKTLRSVAHNVLILNSVKPLLPKVSGGWNPPER